MLVDTFQNSELKYSCYLSDRQIIKTNENIKFVEMLPKCECDEYPCLKSVIPSIFIETPMCEPMNLKACYKMGCKDLLTCKNKNNAKMLSCEQISNICKKNKILQFNIPFLTLVFVMGFIVYKIINYCLNY